MEKYARIRTITIWPKSLRRWYQRHPKTLLAGDVISIAWEIAFFWPQITSAARKVQQRFNCWVEGIS